VPVREGLGRLEGVESISEKCDRRAGTGELRLRNGRLVNPNALAEQIRNIRVGARLRGLEATVDGVLEEIQGEPHLRVGGTKELVALAALTQKVQIDAINKKTLTPTREEQKAFETLMAKGKSKSRRVRITGPLRKLEKSERLVLEVREFAELPGSQTGGKRAGR
jgi:hypothetical protein